MSQHHKATQNEKHHQPPTYFNKKIYAGHTHLTVVPNTAPNNSYKKRSSFRNLKHHVKIGFALGVGALSLLTLMPPMQGLFSALYKMGKKKTMAKESIIANWQNGWQKSPVSKSQNLWAQITKDFTLSAYANNPAVLQQIRWYQAHPQSLSDIAAQAAPYLYYIHQQVKAKGLPGELVLLPIIESAYNPFASSQVGAAGLWQLMPKTGSDLGLKQNAGFDGRRDVVSSTQAALSYLDYLDKIFNKNWLLALAAYNSGPGTVLKADKNNRSDHSDTQFWSLRLPAETKQYVPKLLAVAAIIANPAKYGIQLPNIPNEPYFAKVAVSNPMPLSKVAALSNTPVDEMHSLNPGYKGTQNASSTPEHVLIPIEKVATFAQNMNAQGKSVSVQMPTGTTTNTTPAFVTGSTTVAAATSAPTPAPAPASVAADPIPTPTDNSKTINYTVAAGDTLSKVAAHNHVNLNDLIQWNHLTRQSVLHKGQLLKLNIAANRNTRAHTATKTAHSISYNKNRQKNKK